MASFSAARRSISRFVQLLGHWGKGEKRRGPAWHYYGGGFRAGFISEIFGFLLCVGAERGGLVLFTLLLLARAFVDTRARSAGVRLPRSSVSITTIGSSIPTGHDFFGGFLSCFGSTGGRGGGGGFSFDIVNNPRCSDSAGFKLKLITTNLCHASSTSAVLPPSGISLCKSISAINFCLLKIHKGRLFPRSGCQLGCGLCFCSFPDLC